MSEELQEMQRQIVGAVQQELTRFSAEVATNLRKLEAEVASGAAARVELEDQVRSLASALEHSHVAGSNYQNEIQHVLETRLGEMTAANARQQDEVNARLGRVVDEANVGIIAAVQSAAHPLVKKIEDRQERIEDEVRGLDDSIRRFDDQAGQMVDHINQVTSVVEARLERIGSDVAANLDERLGAIGNRIDDVSAASARHQAEVSNIVTSRVEASEQRSTERVMGLETRLSDEIGQRVADIDAHVGRVGAGLDDAVMTLSDRIAKADSRFEAVEAEFETIRSDLANVDAEAIDEIKDQVGSALGQAELVRIEMDRFQETIRESLDSTALRLTEIETTVNDQAMDVEMAVQLERLEEVERAVLMLDPDILGAAEPEPEATVVDDGVDPHDMIAMLDRIDAPANEPLAPPSAEPPPPPPRPDAAVDAAASGR
ncbi:hypothetical protein [Ilumatobacter sp.]|uniref:hypothetical protein n=1 Tax=Ilumatobacter sp. TaxID=1967498 RepID=UPI003B5195AE